MKIFLLFVALLLAQTTQAQIITTFAGICDSPGAYSGDGGAATNAKLRFPQGAVLDGTGNLYFVELANHVVRKVLPSGVITTVAGNSVSGFSGDGGSATLAQLKYPHGLAIDKLGNLYIADHGNARVRKVDVAGIITTFAGNGTTTSSGDGGPATAAGLGAGLGGVCLDTAGNVYMAGGGYIRKVNTYGIITIVAGTGAGGDSGNGGPATAAQIPNFTELTIDKYNNIYFSNLYNIRKIDASGIVSRIAGNNTGGYSGDNGPATAAFFSSTAGVFLDSCGNIYVADGGNAVIRIISTDGKVYTIAGNGIQGYSGDGGPATVAKIKSPYTMLIGKNNELYISDDNSCVRKVALPRCDSLKLWASEMMGTTEKIEAYPNPNNGEYTLKVSAHTMQPINVSVITMVGTVIDEYTVRAGKEMPITHSLPQGLYILVATTENGRLVSKMVVQ